MSDSERGLREIISDATDRELAKTRVDPLAPEELRDMIKRAESRRRSRRRKMMGAAALFVVAVIGAFALFGTVPTEVGADKNAMEEKVTEDGIVVENEGWDSEVEDNWIIIDWKEVAVAKATIPELLVPEYIPENYKFESLNIENAGGSVIATFTFIENNDEIMIEQIQHSENLSNAYINSSDKNLNSNKGKVYIFKQGELNSATIQTDGGTTINIWYKISSSELIKIINGMN